MDRRAFLRKSTAAAGCGVLAAACAPLPYVSGQRSDGFLRVEKSEVANRPFVLVRATGLEHPIFLRPEGGGYRALSTRCTHKACAVRPSAAELECPCHGSRFGFDGAVLEGPASEPLTEFEVVEFEDHFRILSSTS